MMVTNCKRFKSREKQINPIIFCNLIDKKCPKRDAIQFSLKEYCFQDQLFSKIGPSCCRKLKVKKHNPDSCASYIQYEGIIQSPLDIIQQLTPVEKQLNLTTENFQNSLDQKIINKVDERSLEKQFGIKKSKSNADLRKKLKVIENQLKEKSQEKFIFYKKLQFFNLAKYLDELEQQKSQKDIIPEMQFNNPFGEVIKKKDIQNLICDFSNLGQNKFIQDKFFHQQSIQSANSLDKEKFKLPQEKWQENLKQVNQLQSMTNQSKMIKHLHFVNNIDTSKKPLNPDNLLQKQAQFNSIKQNIPQSSMQDLVKSYNEMIYLPQKQEFKIETNIDQFKKDFSLKYQNQIESKEINTDNLQKVIFIKNHFLKKMEKTSSQKYLKQKQNFLKTFQ